MFSEIDPTDIKFVEGSHWHTPEMYHDDISRTYAKLQLLSVVFVIIFVQMLMYHSYTALLTADYASTTYKIFVLRKS